MSSSSIPDPDPAAGQESASLPLLKKTINNESDLIPIQHSRKRNRVAKEIETETETKTKTAAAASFPYYRGVRRRTWGRYVSEIRIPKMKSRIWLGSFDSPEMAARAYDSAAYFLKGESASLNFPDLAGALPQPHSSSRRDIQIAAAKAAATDQVTVNRNRFELGREPIKDACTPVSGSKEEASWWFLDDELACLLVDDVLPLEKEEEDETTLLGSTTGNYYYSSSSIAVNDSMLI